MLDSVLYIDGFDRDGEPAPDEDEADDYDGEAMNTVKKNLFLTALYFTLLKCRKFTEF